MSKRWIKAASTSQTIDIFVLDSSSTVGAGLTGLVFNTAGLTCYFRKGATATPAVVTLATLAGVTTPWATGGFIAVDATNMPGVYRLDIPNTVIDTAGMVTMYLRGATNMAPVVLELEIVAVDIYDTVRLGLTALPNTAVTTNGSLITSGTGTAQLSVSSGFVTTGTISNGAITSATFGTGAITSTVLAADAINATVIANGAIDAATFATGAINAAAIAADALTSAKFQDGALIIGATTGTGVKISHGVNSITAGVIADAAIDAATFADSALVIGSAAAGGVKAYLGANSITAGVIANGAIDAATFAAGAIDAAAIATDAIDADALATDAVTEIADGILARDIGSGTNALTTLNERTVRSALRALRNKSSIATATLTVTTENDTTTAWTAAVSSSATADPVTGVDPV